MFVSFFPRPKLLFISAIVWAALAMTLWYSYANELYGSSAPVVGVATFWSVRSLWFDLYFVVFVAIFTAAWMWFAPHPWAWWSIPGSALILFATYFQVQVSVAINTWYGPFYDLIQAALAKSRPVTVEEFYGQLATFAGIALVAVIVGVLTRFFVSHYIFRWRTAMNDFYVAYWPRLRTIEGASQRVQEDTMRFATITEGLGVNFISAILTLIAFLPVLLKLSSHVTELPLVGAIPYPLVVAAIVWSMFGTGAAGADRHQAAGHRVLQPAGRGGLPQGARARRRRCRHAPIRRRWRSCSAHSQELFPVLSELSVLQRRPHRLFADRRHLPLHPAGADDRCRQAHAGSDATRS